MSTNRKPVRHLGVAGIAALFDVKPQTVTKWLARYDNWPQPDIELAPGRNGIPDRGWLPEREQEWREWKAILPGQGAAGRPKPRRKGGDN
jgi:hypothetical protein